MKGLLCFALIATAPVLAQPVSLSGTVLDTLGRPYADVTVQVLSNDGWRPRAVIDAFETDTSGRYQFDFDRIGVHLLRVVRDTTEVRGPEVALFVDRPEVVEADLRYAPSSTGEAWHGRLQLDFRQPDSRPAWFARLVRGERLASDPNALDPAMADAVTIQRLAESLRGRAGLSADSAEAALRRLPPDTPSWMASGERYLLLRTIDATNDPEAHADYIEQFVIGQLDPLSVTGVVYTALGRARLAGETERVVRYLDFVRENAAASYWGSRALVEFAQDRAVRPGEPIPSFAFPKLEGSGAFVPEDFAGRVYLIDFWAMWCAPCLAERDALAELYEVHRARGFEIVSVSLDLSRDDVDLERWPMPWHHAYLEPETPATEAIKETFALGSLPKLVLVGADGRVIAGGIELRPEVVGRILPNVLQR
ncbi:MAG: thioredoxin-like domain-containing protein [Bacteroidota bacterium]